MALLVLWSLSLSVSPPLIGEDTKNDLYVDPLGLMGRALHLWDPQVSWGVLQNQGYGYLFPMGPFFAVVGAVLPMWVAQRLWWGLLLTVGYVGMRRLLLALGIVDVERLGPQAAARLAAVGALAYALSPRIVTTIGGLSAETLPVVLAPWILLPLVLVGRGGSARRAAMASGVAVLCAGGVNAAAVLLVLVPAGLWLVTRARWWSSPLTWWTGSAWLLATAWWLGPLLLLGRYSPPFLQWIENSAVVSGPIGLLDVARGTTHWLARIVTPSGPWWPAGHELATSPAYLLLTTAVAALGLAGLARRDLPHRRFVWAVLVFGVLALGLPHAGVLDSPLVGAAQDALDGPLAPFRNIHKADPLVRLPLALGFTRALVALHGWRPTRAPWRRPLALLGVSAVTLGLAGPGLAEGIAVRGTFPAMASQWVEAGDWLSAHHGSGPALIVPSANFGEYLWGRPIDEPLRALSDAPYAVRDSVPLTPAGTIRFLDALEQRLQGGRSIGGAVAALRAAGVRHLVLRNDLDAWTSGQPPVDFARSALEGTPGVRLAAAFGTPVADSGGGRVPPVEIYDLGPATDLAQVWPAAAIGAASGASESVLDLADAGWTAPVIFDGDLTPAFDPTWRVETDGNRARARVFGATRGRDFSGSLTAAEDTAARDYRSWPAGSLRSTLTLRGVGAVSASASVDRDHTFLGLWPGFGPSSALDSDPGTAWAAAFALRPTWRVEFETVMDPAVIHVTPYADHSVFGSGLGVPTTLRVRTESGSREVGVPATGLPVEVTLPAGPTHWVEIEVVATDRGATTDLVTGLAEVEVPGLHPSLAVALAAPRTSAPVSGVVLTTGARAPDGCTIGSGATCLAQQYRPAEESALRREVPVLTPGAYAVEGLVRVDPRSPPDGLVAGVGVRAAVSSSSGPAARAGADALVDEDPTTAWRPAPTDRRPWFSVKLPTAATISGLTLEGEGPWRGRTPVYAEVASGGATQTSLIGADGSVVLEPVTTSQVTVRLLMTSASTDPAHPLSVRSVSLRGVSLPSPPAVIQRDCGQGPELIVDGVLVPTEVTITRADLGGGTVRWRACQEVDVAGDASGGGPHRVSLVAGPGLVAQSVVLTRRGGPAEHPTAPAVEGAVVRNSSPAGLDVALPAGVGVRLLATTMNANPGWIATVGGRSLAPQVVDGFRQAFVVPEGVSGTVLVRFSPDGRYRWLLAVDALGGALVLLGSVWPSRKASTTLLGGSVGRWSAWRAGAACLLVGGALEGLAGLLVVVGALALALLMSRVGRGRPGRPARVHDGWVAAPTLLLAAGLVQIAAPASVGPPWVEGVTRVLVLGAGLSAFLAGGPQDYPAGDVAGSA